ncbi:LicD family [Trinorchestia longiramus]|nr:LicD family [Trinorchestia longiramus]
MKVHLRVLRYLKPRRFPRSSAYTFGFALPLAAVLTLTFAALVLGWSNDSVRKGVQRIRHAVLGEETKTHHKAREPLVMLKRELSAVILKAANDVRWGRPAVAVAELESAAAKLDPRFNNDLDLDPVVVANWPASILNSGTDNQGVKTHYVWDFAAPGGDIEVQPRDTEAFQDVKNKAHVERQVIRDATAAPLAQHQRLEKSSVLGKDKKINNRTQDSESLSWWSELTHQSLDKIEDRHLPSLVTVLIDGCDIPSNMNLQVIDNIKKIWPSLQIKIAFSRNFDQKFTDDVRSRPNVTIHYVECRGSGGQIAPLVSVVSTPFVLFLEEASAVTEDLSIIQMLETVRDTKGVALIGMSERGRDGAWDYICTQLSIKNVRLELEQGYHFSRGPCLFCDVTSSSFFAATWILLEEEVDCTLPEHSRKLDLSLRFQRQGILVMTCPHLMTHINRKVKEDEVVVPLNRPCITKSQRIQARDEHMVLRRQYRKLARKWELTTIVLPNNTRLEYSCLEIHYNCQAVSRVKHYSLPDCCLKIKNRMFSTLNYVARKEHVPFEVNSGSLLGAVKFKDAIPWDFDDDAVYRNKDMKKFLKHKQEMRRLGLSPVYKKEFSANNKSSLHNYFSMTGQGGFSMDLWGVDHFEPLANIDRLKEIPSTLVCFQSDHSFITIEELLKDNVRGMVDPKVVNNISFGGKKPARSSSKNSIVLTQAFTSKTSSYPSCFLQSLVKIGPNWLPGPWNPAQTAQERYGLNLFRHEPHWRMKQRHMTGWSECPRVGHHACLDLHPMDGSLPFL